MSIPYEEIINKVDPSIFPSPIMPPQGINCRDEKMTANRNNCPRVNGHYISKAISTFTEQLQEDLASTLLHHPDTSALLLMLQPSSAPLSSHLRLRANLDIIKENIESRTELNGCSSVLGRGSYVKIIGHKSDICIICADGIDECVARKGYIENLVKEISPKVVVVCMRYGTKRVGEMLRKAGVKNILSKRSTFQGIVVAFLQCIIG